MRVAHDHRPNGLGARNEDGVLFCATCHQSCEEPGKPEVSPLPVVPPPFVPVHSGEVDA